MTEPTFTPAQERRSKEAYFLAGQTVTRFVKREEDWRGVVLLPAFAGPPQPESEFVFVYEESPEDSRKRRADVDEARWDTDHPDNRGEW